MIRLKAYYTQHINAELNEDTVIEAVVEMIQKKHDLRRVDGIDEKGRMYEMAEYATSHSWVSKEDRGVPTEDQKLALTVIKVLRGLK